MFNIYLGIYIVFAILVIAGGTFSMTNQGQTLGGILYFIGALVVLIVFGLKWFSPGSVFSETPVPWPTTINSCPDFLVFYSRQKADGSTQDSCIDLVGVSKNGALKVFPNSGTVPTNDEYYFSLATTSSDQNGKNQELCQKAIAMGLTWEGITNGESCITPAGPVAPSGGGGGGSNCPSK
jgi:hypothetical protein